MPIVADAAVAIRGDLSHFSSDLTGADKQVQTLGQRLKGVLSPRNLGIGGAFVGGFAAFKAIDFLGDAIGAASDLNEQIDKSAIVFGKAAPKVQAFADSAANIGLSKEQALAAAGAYGQMFHTIGLAEDVSGDMSIALVQLAADMGAFNNQDPSEMLDRLRSGLAGEAEPLRQFGVFLSDAAVQAFAYENGIARVGEALTEGQKVQARYGLILESTANQQGNFALTSDALAQRQRQLEARMRDVSASIGEKLLPVMEKLASFTADVVVPAIQFLVDNPMAALVAALPLVVIGVAAVVSALAVLLSPIGLVVAAVAGLALAFSTNFLGIRDIVTTVVGVVGGLISGLVDVVETVTTALSEFFNWVSGNTEAERQRLAQLGDFGGGSSAGGAGGSSAFGPTIPPPKPPPKAGGVVRRNLPEFASGAWSVPRNMLAMLHENEVVVPAGPPAEAARTFFSELRSAANGNGDVTIIKLNVMGKEPVVSSAVEIAEQAARLGRFKG